MSFGVRAGKISSTRAISRTFASSGAFSANSTPAPTSDFVRSGTRSRRLGADQDDAAKDRGDSSPLPPRNVLAQKNGRKAHGNGSIERTKDADDRHVFHLHAAIAQYKGQRIKRAHAESHPTHTAARKMHRFGCG